DKADPTRHVDHEKALMADRRRADSHVHLGRAVRAEKLDDRAARRPAHDRIVYDDHALAIEDIPKRVVLERDALAAELRRRLDERPPDVPVLDEPFAERDAAPAGIADGGGYRAVRHWNHHVGHGRALAGKGLAHTLACRIDRGASKIARDRREVDMLEDAQTTAVRGEVGDRHRAGVVDPQHLS